MFLSVLIEQSSLSGTINFIPYRYLLDAQLTNERLTVSFIKPLVDIPVNSIREVKQIKTITMFGIKITYQAKPSGQGFLFTNTQIPAMGKRICGTRDQRAST
jgi:hypothetical protein